VLDEQGHHVRVTAIIAAGGRGQRFGSARPKQLLTVDGRPMLERSVTLFLDHPDVDEIVVALPADLVADPPPYLRAAPKPIRVVAGGARRQDSVANAFQAASAESVVVVVHDAARPFASADLVSRTIAAAVASGAALAALRVSDTVKRIGDRMVIETLPRESIYLAQTPQAFRREILREALALGEAGGDATDEASLAERAGHAVRVVEGEPGNIKITMPEDLAVAEAIARRAGHAGRQPTIRVGTGYDLHRMVEGRPLILAGVRMAFERGLLGHSDADVVCHAVTDAILGAAAAGDIGRHFPDTDPRWKDASSLDLLRRAVDTVRATGFAVVNIDVVVIAERPSLWPFADAMRANLAEAVGVPVDAVSLKGKTNEGVDATGRGEAIACHAVALITNSQFPIPNS
jgi:2-C-methyl-D-erythritol 4-phosphate cytidylyltransferase / 2-C-methyl-D-erythritol 2,4-cyclodiphosphate synthase